MYMYEESLEGQKNIASFPELQRQNLLCGNVIHFALTKDILLPEGVLHKLQIWGVYGTLGTEWTKEAGQSFTLFCVPNFQVIVFIASWHRIVFHEELIENALTISKRDTFLPYRD